MSEQHPDQFGSDPSALGGNVLEIQCPTLSEFGLGRGQIGKENPLDMQEKKTQEMLQAIATGEFNRAVEDTIPVICIDGRFMEDGSRIPSPATAGGTIGLAYARDIANPGNDLQGADEVTLVRRTVSELKKKGHNVSVHSDNHADHETGCGCGACAKATGIYAKLKINPENAYQATAALGFGASDSQKETYSRNIGRRVDEGNFEQNRKLVLDGAHDEGAELETLMDGHDEKLIIWNTVDATRIDTQAIFEQYGIQVFVVDAWSFKNAGAELCSTGYPEEADAISNALALYNVATADELCADNMPLLIVSQENFTLSA